MIIHFIGILQIPKQYTATDRILEMKKGSRAAVSGKGWGPKPRQKISDITDFPKKRILEIAIFRSWSSKKKKQVRQISTKASNPRCKINFGNHPYRILILQTTWFWLFCRILGQNPGSVLGPLSSKPAGFTAYLHDFGTKSRFNFGALILQTSWFTANLHDFGTKSRFRFGVLILQTTWSWVFFAWFWD